MAEAWGNVAGILISHPRISRKGLQLDKLRAALPEFFKEVEGIEDRRIFLVKDIRSAHYNDEKILAAEANWAVLDSLHDAPLGQLVTDSGTSLEEVRADAETCRHCMLSAEASARVSLGDLSAGHATHTRALKHIKAFDSFEALGKESFNFRRKIHHLVHINAPPDAPQ